MIKLYTGTTSTDEVQQVLSHLYLNQDSIKSFKTWGHKSLSVLKFIDEFDLGFRFPTENYLDLLINFTDEHFGQSENDIIFHNHPGEWVYVQYLNSNFQDGELVFENGFKHKPQTGDVICLTGDEPHMVIPPKNFDDFYLDLNGQKTLIDKRFTLVGVMRDINTMENLLNIHIEDKFKHTSVNDF